MQKNVLKYSALSLSLFMVWLVIDTSIKSDMFNLPKDVMNEPWFWTTLVDFYFNIAIISLWVIYKEANALRSILWIAAFIFLGSVATMFYVFLQTLRLKDNEGLEAVILRRKI